MMRDPRLLLADRSPCLRSRVLDELTDARDVAEVEEVQHERLDDPTVADLLALQARDGHWSAGDGAWRGNGNPLLLTAMALRRLALGGFDRDFAPIRRGVEWLFRHQRDDGAWPMPRPTGEAAGDAGDWSPMQTAIPLSAIAQCGFADDPRAERAYAWLTSLLLDEGVWPTGWTQGDFRRVAGYRVIAQSANGCRSNTTMALECFAAHPTKRHSDVAVRALDLLLGKRSLDASAFGFDLSRILGRQPLIGFISYYARFDALTLLRLAADIGANVTDARVARFVDFADSLAEPDGFVPCPAAPELTRWITFEMLRVRRRIDSNDGWAAVVAPIGERRGEARRF